MKKFILLFSLVIFLHSCQQTELQFSCDPVINAYVTENSEELAQLTVHEITVYELPLQRAIFASWSAEKKRNAWLEKFRYVLENEPLTEAEANHVQALIEHLAPGYFKEGITRQEKKARYVFADGWINYANTKIGWSVEYIGFMVYRLYTSPAQLEAEILTENSLHNNIQTDSEAGNCDCSASSDFCGYLSDCGSGECTTTSGGCGWIWGAPCNGICY